MVWELRERMRKLGAIAALLAILFAVGPTLEAAACATDGCGASCIEETMLDSESPDPAAGGCAEQHCIWSAGHNHAATNLPVVSAEAPLSIASERHYRFTAETMLSATPRGLERPPRA